MVVAKIRHQKYLQIAPAEWQGCWGVSWGWLKRNQSEKNRSRKPAVTHRALTGSGAISSQSGRPRLPESISIARDHLQHSSGLGASCRNSGGHAWRPGVSITGGKWHFWHSGYTHRTGTTFAKLRWCRFQIYSWTRHQTWHA